MSSSAAFDGTGSVATPGSGALTDPIAVARPVRFEPGAGEAGLLFEAATDPLTLDVTDADGTTEVDALSRLVGATLLADAVVTPRVGLGIALPIWLGVTGEVAPGAGLGDLHVTVPIALVRPAADGTGWGASVVPTLLAPSGDADRWLGSGAFGAGLRLVGGYGAGPWRASVEGGLQFSGAEAELGTDPGRMLDAGAALSLLASREVGVTVEGDVRAPASGAPAGEARLSTRWAPTDHLVLTGGIGRAIAPGAGSARLRIFAGISFHLGAHHAKPPVPAATVAESPWTLRLDVSDEHGAPLPGTEISATGPEGTRTAETGEDGRARLELAPGTWEVVVRRDGRITQRRTVVLDADRFRPADVEAVLPEGAGPGRILLHLTDPEDRPVDDATVAVDGTPLGVTGPGGTFAVDGLPAGPHRVVVTAPAFLTAPPLEVPADGPDQQVVLHRPAGAVKVIVRGPDGVVPDALVAAYGDGDVPAEPVGADGERDLVLDPGTWQIVVSSEMFGVQSREVRVERDEAALVVVDVRLRQAERGDAALDVRIVDPDGRPVEGADVLLDGVRVGSTSNAGSLRLDRLAVGARTLEARGDAFVAAAPVSVQLVPGERDLLLHLDWKPGSVLVEAKGPDGAVPDAVVRFVGAATLPAAPLGPDGRGSFRLPPGTWKVVLSSETYGIQERDVVVAHDQTSRILILAVLRAAEAGDADLTVSVRDPDGAPVDGARITIDGADVGATSTGGTLRLARLQPGKRAIAVRADRFEDVTAPIVALADGDNQWTARMRWRPGAVRVHAHTADGAGIDALARFYGADVLPPARLGPSGERTFALTPGPWTAVLSSTAYGIHEEGLRVGAEPTTLDVTLAPVPSDTATLLVQIVDPDGGPVSGATLDLGDRHVPVPDGGAVVLRSLAPGSAPFRVAAPGYAARAPETLTLIGGEQERRVVLGWAKRAVKLRIHAPDGGPVDAEVRLVGPSRVPQVSTGGDGEADVSLRPGAWQVLVSSPRWGAHCQDVLVSPGDQPTVLDVTLASAQLSVGDTAVELRQEVRFATDAATLDAASYPVLDELAATLRIHPEIRRIEVQGHTDAVGTEAYNVSLSQRRADAVRDYLVAHGVARDRLVARGYGTGRSLAPNDTEEGRARNRRVQFAILAR